MSDIHPLCPKCNGLLKYEPADVLGPERVKCILCGWGMIREPKAVPIDKALIATPPPKERASARRGTCSICHRPDMVLVKTDGPCHTCYNQKKRAVEAAKMVIEKAVPVGPLPKFGTCPLCQRTGMNLKHSGKCGRCAYRLANGIDLQLPNQKPGIAASRQWPHTIIATPAVKPEIKETTMSKKITPRGDCPLCKRKDVNMPGPKCSRCYSRLAKGLDVITGLPKQLFEGPCAKQPIIPASSTPEPVQTKPASPVTVRYACHIDPVQCIDAAWASRRAGWIKELTETESPVERLTKTAVYLQSLQSLVEY